MQTPWLCQILRERRTITNENLLFFKEVAGNGGSALHPKIITTYLLYIVLCSQGIFKWRFMRVITDNFKWLRALPPLPETSTGVRLRMLIPSMYHIIVHRKVSYIMKSKIILSITAAVLLVGFLFVSDTMFNSGSQSSTSSSEASTIQDTSEMHLQSVQSDSSIAGGQFNRAACDAHSMMKSGGSSSNVAEQ